MFLKKGIFLVCFALIFTCIGCIATFMPVGTIYTGSILPHTHGIVTTYEVSPDSNFDIIGPVEGTATAHNVLGIFGFGNAGYNAAYQKALEQTGGDALINVRVDMKIKSFLGLYGSTTTIVRGDAIKFRR